MTRNDFPYEGTAAHYLIVARRHVPSFEELPDEAGAELWAIRRELASALGAARATRPSSAAATCASTAAASRTCTCTSSRSTRPRADRALPRQRATGAETSPAASA